MCVTQVHLPPGAFLTAGPSALRTSNRGGPAGQARREGAHPSTPIFSPAAPGGLRKCLQTSHSDCPSWAPRHVSV